MEEWEALKEICEKMYQDEKLAFEMMYSLIDIENKANGINQRKGILDDIDSEIRRTFYKDEEDAIKYYADTMIRKKESGGKYNEKFLDFQFPENEYDEEE